tara:strand:- start:97 stop:525 length:429 start_codon:yes stop_codon:yes gene_type:complete
MMAYKIDTKIKFVLTIIIFLVSCATSQSLYVIDPKTIKNEVQLKIDESECFKLAKTIELDDEKASKALAGIALGAGGAAGAAALAFGAVFPPAIPFIAAAGALGGGLYGASASDKEKAYRTNVLQQCLEERGYKLYLPDVKK